jgi:hypothetical protein
MKDRQTDFGQMATRMKILIDGQMTNKCREIHTSRHTNRHKNSHQKRETNIGSKRQKLTSKQK